MQLRVLDSHTGGEPTRTILSGTPLTQEIASGEPRPSVAQRLETMRRDFDFLRTGLLLEPRGSEVMVGAIVVPPENPANAAGVIFFNNVGYLGMCGHGTIGVVETLRYLGLLAPGKHTIETCVGNVIATLHEDRSVTLQNVPSYRIAKDVPLDLAVTSGLVCDGLVCDSLVCDVAYGGNMFALVDVSDQGWMELSSAKLIELATQVMESVRVAYPSVDHVEFFAEPKNPENSSRSFVLCPGGQYDRSPCGTGTSAKLACLAADGKLQAGEAWRQESFIGSVFEGSFEWVDRAKGVISPSVRSRAFVNADLQLIVDPEDPFAWGIPSV